jgi:hypothetical protein
MTIEERLTQTLRQRAELVRVSNTSWAHIAQSVGRERRPLLRLATAAAAMAVVATGALVLISAGHDAQRVQVVNPVPPTRPPVIWYLRIKGPPSLEIVDVRSGARRTVSVTGMLPYGSLQPWNALRRGKTVVVVQVPGDRNPATAYAVADDGVARSLGPATQVFPSIDENRVWLARVDDRTVREVDVDGRQTQPPRALPSRLTAVQGVVAEGLVCLRLANGDPGLRDLVVWDPVSGKVSRGFAPTSTFVAAAGNIVASQRNVPGGALYLTDMTDGVDQAVKPPARFSDTAQGVGSFSPDGKTLLVVATRGASAVLMSVDVDRRRAAVVPGWQTTSGGWVADGWSSDGVTFFFTAVDTSGNDGRVYTYDRRTGRAAPTAISLSKADASALVP